MEKYLVWMDLPVARVEYAVEAESTNDAALKIYARGVSAPLSRGQCAYFVRCLDDAPNLVARVQVDPRDPNQSWITVVNWWPVHREPTWWPEGRATQETGS